MPPGSDKVAGQLAIVQLSDAPPRRLCPICPTFLDLLAGIRNAIHDCLFPHFTRLSTTHIDLMYDLDSTTDMS